MSWFEQDADENERGEEAVIDGAEWWHVRVIVRKNNKSTWYTTLSSSFMCFWLYNKPLGASKGAVLVV